MISSKQFRVAPIMKRLTAEISSLGRNPFVRVYSDACDQGLELYSDKTGKTSWWVVQRETRDDDGDLIAWILVPTGQSLAYDHSLVDWKMEIFND